MERIGKVTVLTGLAAGAYGIIAADAIGPLGQAAPWAVLGGLIAITIGHTITMRARMKARAKLAARRIAFRRYGRQAG